MRFVHNSTYLCLLGGVAYEATLSLEVQKRRFQVLTVLMKGGIPRARLNDKHCGLKELLEEGHCSLPESSLNNMICLVRELELETLRVLLIHRPLHSISAYYIRQNSR